MNHLLCSIAHLRIIVHSQQLDGRVHVRLRDLLLQLPIGNEWRAASLVLLRIRSHGLLALATSGSHSCWLTGFLCVLADAGRCQLLLRAEICQTHLPVHQGAAPERCDRPISCLVQID